MKGRMLKKNRWAELQRKRILIVEDEAMQALNLAVMVENLGADVAGIATSIQGALAEIAETHFDCVLLDLNLNGFFSIGLLKGLRDMNTPFVVSTAYGHVARGFPEIPVLDKPVSEEALAGALSHAMRGR